MLVSLDSEGALKVWDVQGSRSCTAVPPASPDDELHIIVAHPDGRHMLVGGTRLVPLGGSSSPARQHLLCVLDAQT